MPCLKEILFQALKDVFPSFIRQFQDVEIILRNRLKPSFHEFSELYLDEHPDFGNWRHLYLSQGSHKNLSFIFEQIILKNTTLRPCFENPELSCEELKPLNESIATAAIFYEIDINSIEENDEEVKLDAFSIAWLQLSFITYHNILSVTQNNATINYLLKDFLENGTPVSLIKIVEVDPRISYMPEVSHAIASLPIKDSSSLKKQLGKAEELPSLNIHGNNKGYLLSTYIFTLDFLGLLSKPFQTEGFRNELLELAIEFDVFSVDMDESTFFNKLKTYKS
ncbi:MAG: hypothetical protein IE909_13750 [Campylobacterales bacterium]|nr:hypothetical protein [Campylobacterales bacterium]